ncbi:MAG: hypothetical protein Q4A16_00425 [Lautropia sp.]|nr:hypothetical protein [Lautropia sp.]
MTRTQHSPAIAPLLGDSALATGGALLAIARIIFVELAQFLPEHAALAIWADFHQIPLAWVAKTLTLAAVILVPAFYLLLETLKRHGHTLTHLIWLGIAVVTVVTVLSGGLFAGKLAFAPYDMGMSAEAAELSISLLIICLHICSMALGVGMIILGIGYRNQIRTPYAEFSVLAGVAQLLGAHPWLLPGWSVHVTAVLLFAWSASTLRSLHGIDAHSDEDEQETARTRSTTRLDPNPQSREQKATPQGRVGKAPNSVGNHR